MASVPYCTLSENSNVKLTAVGRCRIKAEGDGYSAFLAQATALCEAEQAQALADAAAVNSADSKAAKATRKKAQKAAQQAAKEWLTTPVGWNLDVSIVDVEVVVPAADIISTHGHVATALLDAGAERIVVEAKTGDWMHNSLSSSIRTDETGSKKTESDEGGDVEDWVEALAAMHLPLSRVMVHFAKQLPTEASVWAQLGTFCDAISLDYAVVGSSTNKQSSDNSSEDGTTFTSNVSLTSPPWSVHALLDTVQTKVPSHLAVHCQIPADVPSADVARVCVVRSPESANHGKFVVRALLTDPTPAQLGMAYAACCRTDRPDGLFATVVCTRQGEALGLVYSSAESIVASLEAGRGVYYSRSRNGLWRKGDTSGHYQSLHRIDVDCDSDALRFLVTQHGAPRPAFCHLNTLSCWGGLRGLRHLQDTIADRIQNAPEGSYTKKLLDDPNLLRNKLVEEAQELAEAESPTHVAEELADVLYFSLTRAVQAGVSLDDAVCELDRRTRKVTRRPGLAKDFRIAAGEAILEQTKGQE